MPKVVPEPGKATRREITEYEIDAPPLPGIENRPPATESADDSQPYWPKGAHDAFDYLRKLTPAEWEEHMVYLYWRPAGTRRLGNNIEKITEPISIDWIGKKFGGSSGGEFIVWVNHEVAPEWRKTTIVPIEGDRIFKGQPVGMPGNPAIGQPVGNATLEKLLQTLVDKLTGQDPNYQGILDMQKKGFETTIETMARKTGEDKAPGIREMIGMLKDLGLVGSPAGGGLLDTIRVLKELGLIGGQAQDPVKMLENVGKLIETAKSLAGDSAGEGDDFKTSLVKAAVQVFPQVRAMTNDLARAAEFNAAAAQHRPAGAPPAETTTVDTSENPASQPPPATAPAAGFDIADFVWDRVLGMIVAGMDGDQIAQWIAIAAPEMFEQLKSFTEGGLLKLFDSNPTIKTALEGKDSLALAQHFVYFCQTGEMWEEPETDEIEPKPVSN